MFLFFIFTLLFFPWTGSTFFMSMSACLSVCLPASMSHISYCISQKPHSQTSSVFDHGSVLLWRRDILCTSGFVDDVMLSNNRLCGASCVFFNGESVTAETASSSPIKFCSLTKIGKYTSWIAHWESKSVLLCSSPVNPYTSGRRRKPAWCRRDSDVFSWLPIHIVRQ